MKKNENAQRMQQINGISSKVYSFMLQDHTGNWAMDVQHWDWVPGVGLISMLHYLEQTKNEAGIQWLEDWIRRNMDKAEDAKTINSMAPFAVFPPLYERTGNLWYLEKATEIGKWMLHEAPRTREGAFEHTVTEDAKFPEQVWADTIFMAVLFLARLSRVTGVREYGDEAVKQLLLHVRLLQDPDTGVLFHGWDCGAGNHMSAARWARANAWIALATPLIAAELKETVPFPDEILERYNRMMKGLIRFQKEDGLWHTVLDRDDFYKETSGSAGIACGILLSARAGMLSEAEGVHAGKTVRTLLTLIAEDGEVKGVSSGTPVFSDISIYNQVPVVPALYGQGLSLFLLVEAASWLASGRQLG